MLPVFWLYIWRQTARPDPAADVHHARRDAGGVHAGADGLWAELLNFFDQKVPLEEFIKRLAKDGLGSSAIALLVALVLSFRRLRFFPRDLLNDPHVLVWTAAIVLFFLSYTRLPHEIAYLIPLFRSASS
jgi:hypothetical protein